MVKQTTNKKQYQVSLNEGLVNKAKSLQLKLAKAENLSGLIDSLISDWVSSVEKYLEHQKGFDELMAKKIKEEVKK